MSGIKEITSKVKECVNNSIEPMKKLTAQAKEMASKNASSVSVMEQKIRSYNSSLKETKMSMKDLHAFASDMELEGLNPYAVLSVRDSFRLLGEQINETVPLVANVSNALRENLNGEYGDSLLMKMRDIGNKAIETGRTIKENLGNAISGVKEKVAYQLAPITDLFKNTGLVAKGVFQRMKADISQSANTTGTPLNKLKKLIQAIRNVGKESEKSKKKTKSFGSDLASTFSSGLKSIKKFALSLLSVRTAFSMVSRAMQSYLNYDTQLSDSIQNCWNVLGSLLAPILERLVSLFSILVSYVNAFVKALTGIDLVARANAKSLNKQAKATKEASKQLSGLDDLNNLTTNSGGGGDTASPITTQDVDLGNMNKLLDLLEKAKEIMLKLFEPIKTSWDKYGQGVIDSMKNAFNGIKDFAGSVLGSIFEVWTNGTGEKYVSNQLKLFTDLFNIIGNIGKALSNAWDNAGNGTAIIQAIADVFIYLQDIVLSITNSLLEWTLSPEFQEALNVVVQIISDLFGYLSQIAGWIANMYETYLAPVVNKILACLSKIIIAIGAVWDFLKPVIDTIIEVIETVLEPVIDGICGFIGGIIDALSGVMDFITGVFTGDWEKAWTGIKEFFGGIIDAIASIFRGLFDTIVALFKGAWDIIKSVWNVVSTWFNDHVIKPVANFFSGMWDKVKNGAKNAWEGIKNVFSSVASFFGNIFSTAWNKVKNIFSTDGQVFSGIKDGIFNAFKKVVNTLTAGINKVVAIPFNAINSALKTVRDISFLGISPFKGLIKLITVPQIPSLANGGVFDQETIVRVAEYSNAQSKPEIISPVDLMDRTFRNALEDVDFGTRIDRLTIKYLDENVYDGAIDYINEQTRIKGVSVIKGVD